MADWVNKQRLLEWLDQNIKVWEDDGTITAPAARATFETVRMRVAEGMFDDRPLHKTEEDALVKGAANMIILLDHYEKLFEGPDIVLEDGAEGWIAVASPKDEGGLRLSVHVTRAYVKERLEERLRG